MIHDLHQGFTDPGQAAALGELHDFLNVVDRIPEIQAYKRKFRPRLELRPGETLLEIGCGVGIEACRLAWEYPHVTVIGLDRETMLATAMQRAAQIGAKVQWLVGEAEAIPLADASVDACLTERVLKYLPNPAAVIAEMVRVLKPGGRIVSFELDYDSTILGGDPAVAGSVSQFLNESVGEARMGRKLPSLLREAGLIDVTFEPVSFCPPWLVYEAAVGNPVREAIRQGRLPKAETSAWLARQAEAFAAGVFTSAFVGFLVSGRLPERQANGRGTVTMVH